ncbi:MAG: nucleotidyltransferase domain-containing protein [Candidatus Aenigmarchaeota archaeon]|nr:nucleotidyltransferase domain-containing protein [Candidatus Aenigmarchaeota archaeon]
MDKFNMILGNKIPLKILRFLMNNPSSEFYEKELIEKLKISKGSVRKWLILLEKMKFILIKRKGRLKIIKINKENSLVKQIKILNTMFKIVPYLYKEKIDAEVYLFGSCSRGENDEKSDIDILIIAKNKERSTIITKVKKINKKIKITFYTPLEWAKAAKKDPAFYERVEKDKIKLI